MEELIQNILNKDKKIKAMNNLIKNGKKVLISGVHKKSNSFFLFNSFKKINNHLLVVVENKQQALDLEDELKAFTDDVKFFPKKEIMFFDSYAHSKSLENNRLEILNELLTSKKRIIITTAETLVMRIIPRNIFNKNIKSINFDSIIKIEDFREKLNHLGYEETHMVINKGYFSIRGGIIDIFPIHLENPIRIELFGDEIDSLRSFDISTQRTIENINDFKITPCKEIILNKDRKNKLIDKFKNAIDENRINKKHKEIYQNYIEKLENGLLIDGIDNYLPIVYNEKETLLDYFDNSLIALIGTNRLFEKIEFNINDIKERFNNYLDKKEVISSQLNHFISINTLKSKLNKNKLLFIDYLKKRIHHLNYDNEINFNTEEISHYKKDLDLMVQDLKVWEKENYQIVFVINDPDRLRKLKNFLANYDYLPKLNYKTMDYGEINIVDNLLKDGCIFKDLKLVVITENELFDVRKFKKKNLSNDKSKIINSYDELKEGDLVVHENHGIGKFVGIHKLQVGKDNNDYLKIQYSGTDVLYVPVNNFDIIQKYIGKKNKKLSSLNSDKWKKKKARVKKSIEEMTDELLELYATREKLKGFSCRPDSKWQKQFEDEFPYTETPDQLTCIKEIKKDMESNQPMERLLCGDVGYGKTEVAMRAMFKAVDNSKQVAFLVPTTILAQQHFKTIKDRFKKYPIEIEVLSRFKTPKQQKKVIKKVKKGLVDILVGTHRILSDDISYKNLGLLVIDEEQRFGVKAKEKIKFLKENIDILSLTATPIPRTLHMSLIGIRDISIIEDPPENRYPIQTYIAEFDEVLIKESIRREINRNGQVYFVHNRVKDIDEFSLKVKELVPNLRVKYAHGQMSSNKLESIMLSFLNKEFDVLISTTIIETGLDISSVNTILINDADRFGLSQLYQLRGRVGRSNKVAYAYMLYKKNKVLSEVAEKRLKAIKSFTELGAGFKIAMRDLEIRGTGNLLGVRQSGQMDAIGYELYTQLLEDSIKKAKGIDVKEKIEANVNFNLDGYIPDSYISNAKFKLEMYKKVSSIETLEDISDLQDEFIDRFGDLPKVVNNLIKIAFIKSIFEKIGVYDIRQKKSKVEFKFKQEIFNIDLLSDLIKEYKNKIRFSDPREPYFEFRFKNTKLKRSEKLQMIYNLSKKVYKKI
ncbi:MAG: transcription-repair coupling factor [Bacillota bacterium]